jgi:uncharacterized repeat protein (TIGR03803 family)
MSGTIKLLFGAALALAILAPAMAMGQTLQTFVLPSGATKNPAPDGALPAGGVIAEAGYLYGTTPSGANNTNPPYRCGFSNGCGTVFRVNVATGKLTTIYKFCSQANCTDGGHPVAGLVYKAGAYYGTTETGGNGTSGLGAGTVFKLTPPAKGKKAWKETVLYSFCSVSNCADGNNPQSTLVFDKAGNLYGTTRGGAPEGGYGTVFELNPKTGALTTLYTFSGGSDGSSPYAGVVFGKGGMLYGTTLSGGTDGNGTVFEVNPTTKTLTTVYAFPTVSCPPNNCYPNGQGPYAGLVVDAKGSLYGTTSAGGANDYGAIFEVTPGKKGAWIETVLYSFTAGNDGYDPAGPVAFDSAGFLYGTTEYGGAGTSSQGTIFQFNATAKSLITLYSFDGLPPQGCPPNCETYYPNGDQPVGTLSIDTQTGAIYGTTQGGGSVTDDNCFNDFDSGCGTVFALTP